jgi:hypothetical protein
MGFPLVAALPVIGKTIDKVLDKLFPDPIERAKAELEVKKLDFEENALQLSAILAEAKSADPWTSRARPSFLYVIYIMILMAIPMGVLSAFHPEAAKAIAEGMKAWLAAIPEALWAVFGVGYTGYTMARSVWDKNAFTSIVKK